MFTGIIETIGTIEKIENELDNVHITITSEISQELKIDQSISHQGVCLTVTQKNHHSHTVTAIQETLRKTNLKHLKTGDLVNLERCLKIGDRLDGHWVQGHVDCTVKLLKAQTLNGSWEYVFELPETFNSLVVPKGSVCINGVSLTVVDVGQGFFSVHIIPYTFEHTTFKTLNEGDEVNIEWDVLGKYIHNMLKHRLGNI